MSTRHTATAVLAAGNETKRLDGLAWTDAALAELAENGVDRVRVEVLAKRLTVTKGSFYWHFKDRDALLVAMLDRWRRRATLSLIERLDRGGGTASERLHALLRLPMSGEKSALAAEIELAIRLWGRTDARARSALEEVDQLRLRYLGQLFAETGLEPSVAHARAVLAYSYQRVAATLIVSEDIVTVEHCEATLLAKAS